MQIFFWIAALILVEIVVIYNMKSYVLSGEKKASSLVISLIGYALVAYIVIRILELADDIGIFFIFRNLVIAFIAFAMGFFVFHESPPSTKQSVGIAFAVLAIFLIA
ncbi:conserved hypothetical protein [Lausannevirus]|uniref:Uncharacterized protein n=2 Tax=Lausannevirus TaxID=999883 RepID=A0A0N9PYU4_9VIRU|nr:hypothetical protein LAU_0139 [Lausannevirus]AEA06990.1 conserved hypothetical protein [Lausannevirus]ALH06819.1 hypothetical protein PMV_121 [Port-miou virus]